MLIFTKILCSQGYEKKITLQQHFDFDIANYNMLVLS